MILVALDLGEKFLNFKGKFYTMKKILLWSQLFPKSLDLFFLLMAYNRLQTGSMVKAGSCKGNVYILLCRSTRYFTGHWTNVPLYPDLWVWGYCLLCNLIINYLSFTYLFIPISLQFVTVNISVLSLTEIMRAGIPLTLDLSMTHAV